MTARHLESSGPDPNGAPAAARMLQRLSSSLPLKRLFDLLLVLLTSPVWLPCVALLAVWVRLGLGRPVFFVQQRVGRGGHIFDLHKFRSMTDSRDERGQLLPDAERLTPFGRLLRSTSLDELPSLINVLRGEMSLVGPRPLLVEYLPLYTSRQARRHEVLPGVTGWAQVNGRNASSWEQRLEHDVWYVEHRSLGLDLRILAATVGKVLRREGVSAAGHATMQPFRGSAAGEADAGVATATPDNSSRRAAGPAPDSGLGNHAGNDLGKERP